MSLMPLTCCSLSSKWSIGTLLVSSTPQAENHGSCDPCLSAVRKENKQGDSTDVTDLKYMLD